MKIEKSIWCVVILLIINFSLSAQDVDKYSSLNQTGALRLAKQAGIESKKIDKDVSVAILNSSGVTLLLLKANTIGPHNTEASRRKAYTALSTKTPTLELMHKAAQSTDAKNLNSLPELLLLGGGVPIWKDDELIGSIGVSGGGGGENDHNIALKAVENLGFKINR